MNTKEATIIRKTIQGQDVDFFEVNCMWAYQIVNAPDHWGQLSKFVMGSQCQAEGRAKKYIEMYYASQSND